MKLIKSRRTLRVIVVVTRSCRLRKTHLAAIERLGYLSDGY